MTPQERLDQTVARLAAAGFTITPTVLLGGTPALMAHTSEFRWRWMAVRMHLLVYIQTVDTVTLDGLKHFTDHSLSHAIASKGELRGLQVGVAAVPIQIGVHVADDARRYAEAQIPRKYGAFAWPVTVETTSGQVTRHTGRPMIGAIFSSWMRERIDTITAGG